MRHKAPGGLVDEILNRRRSTCKTEGEAGRGRVCHLPEPKVTFPSARSQKTVLAHRTHLCWQSLCSGIPVCHACWKPSCIHPELIQKKVTGAFLPRQAVTLRYLTVTKKAAECHQSVCKHSCPSCVPPPSRSRDTSVTVQLPAALASSQPCPQTRGGQGKPEDLPALHSPNMLVILVSQSPCSGSVLMEKSLPLSTLHSPLCLTELPFHRENRKQSRI